MSFLVSYLPDITVFNIVLALCSGGCWFGAIALVQEAFSLRYKRQKLRNGTWLSILGGVILGIVLSRAAYENTRRIHWLRVGALRYTVATVTRTFFARSGRKFSVRYQVGSYQGQDQGECGEACPALHSRRYVRFAAQAPDVCELTQVDVPDSVHTIPPLGWAKLP